MFGDGMAASGGIDGIGGIDGRRVDVERIPRAISRIQNVDHIHVIQADAETGERAAQLDDPLERRVRTGRVPAAQSRTDDGVRLWAEGDDAQIGIETATDAPAAAYGFVQ